MARRSPFHALLVGALLVLGACRESESGPIRVSAIGSPPERVNPNLRPLDPASAFLLEATAQGLVRFDAAGEIEPALAQSWIVSDDGRRYTFRIRRARWSDGSRVTAQQVAARLRAASSRASRNPLKPILGAVDDVVAMTDQVLEITLKGPRPNFLQMLAQPEMAIAMNGAGTGPYAPEAVEHGALRLEIPRPDEDDEEGGETDPLPWPDILLRGEPASAAVSRFAIGEADLVVGGTAGDLPFARAAGIADNRVVFDPAEGLFGLAFTSSSGPVGSPAIRAAMSMAVDRAALVRAIGAPGLQPRFTLLPPGGGEATAPAGPDWIGQPMPMRRELAARIVAELDERPRIRVAMPEGPGYRLIFAHLRRDWRLIGIEAERVGPDQAAELAFIDSVAPTWVPGWYYRHFTCDAAPVCDAEADAALELARTTSDAAERRAQFANADRLLSAATPFIPIATPVRWSLVSTRLTGFRPNPFALHSAGTLIARTP